MIKLLIYYLLFFSVIFAEKFLTPIGNCSLEIYHDNKKDISEIIELIKNETEYLVNKYGNVNKRKFSIIITDNNKEFYKKTKGFAPEWSIAIARKKPDIIIMKSPGLAKISYMRMKEVLIHEINHIYLYRIPNNNSIPSWFKEGMAMHRAGELSLLHKIEISVAYWNNQIIPLNELQNISLLNKRIKLAYGHSAAAIEALEFYYGKKILINILDNMKDNMNFKNAFEFSIKDNSQTFYIKFEEYIKNNYSWIFLFKSPQYIYVLLPVILSLGFIYSRYRNKMILKQWEIEEKINDNKCTDELPN